MRRLIRSSPEGHFAPLLLALGVLFVSTELGSVEVPALFEIERYPTLLQMTSTVTASGSACCWSNTTTPCTSTSWPSAAAMSSLNSTVDEEK